MAMQFTVENFEKEVLGSDVPVLVDFWAEWCGPCRMLAPVIESLAGKAGGAYKVGKVNVDEQQELAAAFNVMSIPTLIVLDKGQVVNQSVGVRPKKQILTML